MVSPEHILHLPLTQSEILASIQKAMDNSNISGLDNLRNRHINIQFDCMLRGFLGEFAIQKWLSMHGIEIEKTNLLPDGDQVDIDFVYKGKNLELKTSLVPDADKTVLEAIAKRDIKLIKRESKIENFRGDIHLQVFFDQKRKAKDNWLRALTIDFDTMDINHVYSAIFAKRYQKDMYFVGWMDKISLVQKINSLHIDERTWTFSNSKKEFWNCKIQESRKPTELIDFLKSI